MKIRVQATLALSVAVLAQMINPQLVIAGPASDAALRAEKLLENGETLPAYNAFDTAQHAFWHLSPLVFRKAILVNRAGSFGDYDLRDDAQFNVGDTLMVYAEPVGFGIGTQEGKFQISFDTDFSIETASGTVLVRRENLFSVRHSSRSRNRDFNMNLSFIVPALKPGDYVSIFTVKDAISRKSGEFRIPFTIGDSVN